MGKKSSSVLLSNSKKKNAWISLNRLSFLAFALVSLTFFFVDRQSLSRDHQFEISKLKEELRLLEDQLEELTSQLKGSDSSIRRRKAKAAENDPISDERREKVKEAMLHAWTCYEKYAWGHDELQPQTRNGIDSFGGLGATLIDSLDTLFIMGLHEQFQRAREWIANSLDFNKNYEASVFETTIRLHHKSRRRSSQCV